MVPQSILKIPRAQERELEREFKRELTRELERRLERKLQREPTRKLRDRLKESLRERARERSKALSPEIQWESSCPVEACYSCIERYRADLSQLCLTLSTGNQKSNLCRLFSIFSAPLCLNLKISVSIILRIT